MEESCAYCGEEIQDGGFRQNDQVFCCQPCVDAAHQETFDVLDAAEYDEV